MGSRGSGGRRRIRIAATGSTGIALTLFIEFRLLSWRVQVLPRAAVRCEVLHGMVAFSAMPSSAMGYIGPCGDMPGQLIFKGENRTGVTSVLGGYHEESWSATAAAACRADTARARVLPRAAAADRCRRIYLPCARRIDV